MQYVIWGAGRRGKRLFSMLGVSRIIAFIDEKKEIQGKSLFEKPIVSYATYKRLYDKTPVIISMMEYENAESKTQSDGIPYFVLSRQPAECSVRYQYQRNIFVNLPFKFDEYRPCVFYGLNLVSAELINRLDGKTRIYIIPADGDDACTKANIKKLFTGYYYDSLPEIDGAYNLFLSASKFCQADRNCYMYNLYDFTQQIKEYHSIKIESLKKKFSGKRCFVVATGPSLRIEDLDVLHSADEYCISMNTIYEAFSKTLWRPNLYLAVDVKFLDLCLKKVEKCDTEMKFIGDIRTGSLENISVNEPLFHAVPADLCQEAIPFSDDVSWVAYDAGSITYICLQFAAYMGFSEIFLLGLDFSIGKHFHEQELTNLNEIDISYAERNYLNFSLRAYRSAKKYADSHGIKIYNATRGGALEIFERFDFDSLF